MMIKCSGRLLLDALEDNFSLFSNGHDCWVKCLHTIMKDIKMMYVVEKPKNCKLNDILIIKRELQQRLTL